MVQWHNIAWREAEILDSNPLLHQQCAIEAWQIHSQTNPINRQIGLFPTAYNPDSSLSPNLAFLCLLLSYYVFVLLPIIAHSPVLNSSPVQGPCTYLRSTAFGFGQALYFENFTIAYFA